MVLRLYSMPPAMLSLVMAFMAISALPHPLKASQDVVPTTAAATDATDTPAILQLRPTTAASELPPTPTLGSATSSVRNATSNTGATPSTSDPQGSEPKTDSPGKDAPLLHRICHWIAREAEKNALPPTYFGRLLWVESRYDPNARSHMNAQGIAQFIPGTAKLRGLENPYDPESAIVASAAYLAEMRDQYGNLGQAAIGYNGGEGRLQRWRKGRSALPTETRNYVSMITGLDAENWREAKLPDGSKPAWDEKTDAAFLTRCKARKIRRFGTGAVAGGAPRKPWGLRVAGHVRRATALSMWQRVKRKHRRILGKTEPMVLRARNRSRGGVSQHSVVVGTDSRKQAQKLCARLQKAGGFCQVVKN